VHLYGRHRDKMRLVEPAGVTTETVPQKLPVAAWPFVVDATGSSEGLRAAVSMCVPRGTVIMKSTVHGLVSIDTAAAIVNEITLVGSRCGRFEAALPLLTDSANAGRAGSICVILSSSVREPIAALTTSNFLRPGLAGLIKSPSRLAPITLNSPRARRSGSSSVTRA